MKKYRLAQVWIALALIGCFVLAGVGTYQEEGWQGVAIGAGFLFGVGATVAAAIAIAQGKPYE